jgi:hypothetical protein
VPSSLVIGFRPKIDQQKRELTRLSHLGGHFCH